MLQNSEVAEGQLSAVIDVEWALETPLLIGEGDETTQPFMLGDKFAIPGATLRGALRAITEAHAFARLFQINHVHGATFRLARLSEAPTTIA